MSATDLRAWVVAAVAGLLFGAGLVLSDMASPVRVLGFLQLDANWDATLAWVMAGALAVSVPGFALARRHGRPLFAGSFSQPPAASVDRRLLVGAALFGLGWGLSGYCPGPVLVNAALALEPALWFIPAMLAGGWLAGALK